MAVSLDKTTFSVRNGASNVRSKEYTSPRNAMKFAGLGLPTGEHALIATTGTTEKVTPFLRK